MGAGLRGRPCLVHFNTWEAIYFDHDEARLRELADLAASVGVERFVLDDGWFRNRIDDRRGLGDWTPDPIKYPDGLGPLIAHVRNLGMSFGLWVEPEMANADSDLLRSHPDWIIGEPGRDQPLGRGQYVLDLSRPEVAENIFQQLDVLLRDNAIDYLKWDMNRDLTHPVSGGRWTVHRQTLAVYRLIDRVRAAHPKIQIESCASGSGGPTTASFGGRTASGPPTPTIRSSAPGSSGRSRSSSRWRSWARTWARAAATPPLARPPCGCESSPR